MHDLAIIVNSLEKTVDLAYWKPSTLTRFQGHADQAVVGAVRLSLVHFYAEQLIFNFENKMLCAVLILLSSRRQHRPWYFSSGFYNTVQSMHSNKGNSVCVWGGGIYRVAKRVHKERVTITWLLALWWDGNRPSSSLYRWSWTRPALGTFSHRRSRPALGTSSHRRSWPPPWRWTEPPHWRPWPPSSRGRWGPSSESRRGAAARWEIPPSWWERGACTHAWRWWFHGDHHLHSNLLAIHPPPVQVLQSILGTSWVIKFHIRITPG